MKSYRLYSILFVCIALLTACAPATPTVAPTATLSGNMISTSIAATVAAIPSFTPLPTDTPLPTRTATQIVGFELTPANYTATPVPPTALVVPTIIPPTVSGSSGAGIPSLTPIPGPVQGNSEFSCMLLTQTPLDWSKLQPRDSFDAKWKVRNVGNRDWAADAVNFVYLRGTAMHLYGSKFDLSKDVKSGSEISFVVDMSTPKEPGTYTAVWGLTQGSRVFCELSLSIIVQGK
jgi:hypothetical protein